MRKKLIVALLACLLVVGLTLPAGAASAEGPVMGDAALTDGAVTVTLRLRGDSGVTSGSLEMHYGSTLACQDVQATPTLVDVHMGTPGVVSCAWTSQGAEEDPMRLTLTFTGAKNGTHSFDVKNIRVYDANYQAIAQEDVSIQLYVPCSGEDCPAAKFTDLNPQLWYHEAVDYVLANGIMEGMGNHKFAPNVGLTRGMLIKILGTLAGMDPRAYEAHSFQDVPASAWYAPYVEWACQNGLARGYGDNRFAPNRLVSREEMVTFLYRFWQLQGGSWTVDDTAYRSFSDRDRVSPFAVEAMQWATDMGIIHGMGDGRLSPQGMSSRAQAAKVILAYQGLN